jgi:hypothetical protein
MKEKGARARSARVESQKDSSSVKNVQFVAPLSRDNWPGGQG